MQIMSTIVQVNEAVYQGAKNPAAGGHHTCHGTEIVGPVSGVGDEVVPSLVVDVFGEDAALDVVLKILLKIVFKVVVEIVLQDIL